MQIDTIVLYNHAGDTREIDFQSGTLNVITGESGTGKSSLIGIIRFLLGGESPNVPVGAIQNSVAWYGMLAHVGSTPFFVGRPAPKHGATTSRAMLSVGKSSIPEFEDLTVDSNRFDVISYIGGLLGIEDNLNVPAEGQTRDPLVANLRHSLYYCFQGQGEIANPDILFHRQNKEFQAQAIRDTLPYFLGAQGADTLQKRQLLTQLRRQLRRERRTLEEATSVRETSFGRAAALIAEARSAGLLEPSEVPANIEAAVELLSSLLDTAESSSEDDSEAISGRDSEVERLLEERRSVRATIRSTNDSIRGLDNFARIGDEYGSELNEHRVRLASIGLIEAASDPEAQCPLCHAPLEEDGVGSEIRDSLEKTSLKLDLAHRDQPRIHEARETLLTTLSANRARLIDIERALEALANSADVSFGDSSTLNQQSFVRGRIAQYLDTTTEADDADIVALEGKVASLSEEERDLAEELDPESLRSATDSLLNIVGRQMTALAKSLPLEHSEHGVRIDPYRLTVVADTLQGPAYMDAGAIGSGMNWVGYHLTAYLALQEYFISARRPVPRFLVIDQPSQAFFPQDKPNGGELEELSDVERDNTRKLYRLMHDTTSRLEGSLQIIALDHANFDEPWFQESVVEVWREGNALIPSSWVARYANRDEG